MFTIQLLENSNKNCFSAQTLFETIGTLSFVFSGSTKIVVDSLDIRPDIFYLNAAYELLDSVHRYAYENNYDLFFRCPKARALNDQQIAQELRELGRINTAAA